MTNSDEELLKSLGLDEPVRPSLAKPTIQKPSVPNSNIRRAKPVSPQRSETEQIEFVEAKPKKRTKTRELTLLIAMAAMLILLIPLISVWQSTNTSTVKPNTAVRQAPERPAWADGHKYQVRESDYRDGIRKAEKSLELAASLYNNLIGSMPNHAMQQGDYDDFKGDKASLDIWISKRADVRKHTRELILELDAAIAGEAKAITSEFTQGGYSPFLDDVFEIWKAGYTGTKERILEDFRKDEARGF